MEWTTGMPILAGTVALIAAMLLTWLVVRFAHALGVVDDPNTRDHPAQLHSQPIPRGGGIALFGAIFGTACFFVPLSRELIAIFVGASVVVTIGFLDDRRANIHPYARLLAQLFAAGTLLAGGVAFQELPDALSLRSIVGFLAQDGQLVPWPLILTMFSIVWTVGLMNAVSWSSGVDGQISGVIALTAFALAGLGHLFGDAQIDRLPFALAIITAGAYAGFFLWHAYPQKIMPGFGGATLAGFLLASASMLDVRLLPALVTLLAVPLIDAAWIVLKRASAGRNPIWGDASHLHHRLLDMGWSRQEVAFFYWFATTAFGAFIFSVSTHAQALACGAILGMTCGIITWINSASSGARGEGVAIPAEASGDRSRRGLDAGGNGGAGGGRRRQKVVQLDSRPRLRGHSPEFDADTTETIRLTAGQRRGWGPRGGS